MTKNEIVAGWMGFVRNTGPTYKNGIFYEHPDKLGMFGPTSQPFKYDSDRNWLHEAWVKFRDLKFNEFEYPIHGYSEFRNRIEYAILHRPITEAFDELVKGIEWAQNHVEKSKRR